MDYKHIEELLEQYWNCETSLEEEATLRIFFVQEDVPAHLLPYKDLFVYQHNQKEVELGEEFDARVLTQIETSVVVNAKSLTLVGRFKPLLKAAAVVAIIVTLGNVVQHGFFAKEELDYDYTLYRDTYNDPEMAYKQVSSALLMLSEGLNKSTDQQLVDSILPTDKRVKVIKD